MHVHWNMQVKNNCFSIAWFRLVDSKIITISSSHISKLYWNDSLCRIYRHIICTARRRRQLMYFLFNGHCFHRIDCLPITAELHERLVGAAFACNFLDEASNCMSPMVEICAVFRVGSWRNRLWLSTSDLISPLTASVDLCLERTLGFGKTCLLYNLHRMEVPSSLFCTRKKMKVWRAPAACDVFSTIYTRRTHRAWLWTRLRVIGLLSEDLIAAGDRAGEAIIANTDVTFSKEGRWIGRTVILSLDKLIIGKNWNM